MARCYVYVVMSPEAAVLKRPALSEKPAVHPTAHIRSCCLGPWTAVGARTTVAESSMGAYSYVVNDSNIVWSDIGKFCSIAAHTRLNPGNHPLERVALHHFTYRSKGYQLARRTITNSSLGAARIRWSCGTTYGLAMERCCFPG